MSVKKVVFGHFEAVLSLYASSGWNDGSSRSDKTPPREKIEKLITPSSGWNDGSRNSTRSSESRSRIDGPSRRKREYHSNGGHSSGGQYNSGGRSSPVESVISVIGVIEDCGGHQSGLEL